MPNWCVNQVDISGDEAEVARLVEFVKGDGDSDAQVFDFAKIVPPPDSKFYAINEEQNHFQCGCKDEWTALTDLPKVETLRYVDGKEVKEMDYPHERMVNGKPIVRKEPEDTSSFRGSLDYQFGGTELCPDHLVPRNTNHPDWWYNWNVENWGSKWNCGEVWNDRADDDNKTDGRTSYNFDTAWSPAEAVIAALAKQFPALTIAHRYCEGGMGFAGEIVYRNGEVVDVSEYGAGDLPDDAWLKEEDGSNSWERDYDKVPMSKFEKFCDEYFGGVVGG